MAQNTIKTQIGNAWAAHRAGRNADAIREFEQILRVESDNVDAHYGLGLARRASHDYAGAKEAFDTALQLAKQKLDVLQGEKHQLNPETYEDDRYMMLTRMIGQRQTELKQLAGKQ